MVIALATGVARAADPMGPAAAEAPAVTAAPESAPAPAPAPAPSPIITAAPSEPAAAPDSTTPPMMRDPFRPDSPATALTPASPTRATTTTTTVVVTERVRPVPPPPPPARERVFVGGYGGFGGRLGPTAGRVSVFSNIRGGLLIGKRLSLGGSLVQMTKRLGAPIRSGSGREYQLGLAYGGVNVGIVGLRRGRFEIGVDSLFGVGLACVYQRESSHDRGSCVESVKLFVAEPGAFIHFNLTNWMRVGLNGGYRFVGRPAWPSGANFRLASPFFGANLDFGWFRRRDV